MKQKLTSLVYTLYFPYTCECIVPFNFQAIEKYKEGIRIIDEALSIPLERPPGLDPAWETASTMVQKIKKARAEVLTRINCIQSSPQFQSTSSEEPPSYEEVMSSINTSEGKIHFLVLNV